MQSIKSVHSKCILRFYKECFSSQQLHTRFIHQAAASSGCYSKYGGRYTVTLIPGDGCGPEIMGHVKRIFEHVNVPVDFEEVVLRSKEDPEVEINNAITAIKRNGVALCGNFQTHFESPTFKSQNVSIRKALDVYANVLVCKSIPGLTTKHDHVDIVIIRENTEGEYSGMEHESVPGVVESLKIITRSNSERIANYAFNYAKKHNRKKVTAVHKANIMKLGDGLFLETCRKVSKNYPHIEFGSMIVDNCCMQMVSNPQQFDVMLLPNLYGNIVGNIGCGLVGGPGIVAGKNMGDRYAVYETGARTTGYRLAGQDKANPTAMILAAADMLEYLNLKRFSERIKAAVTKVLVEDELLTEDLGGTSKASTFVDSILQNLPAKDQCSHL